MIKVLYNLTKLFFSFLFLSISVFVLAQTTTKLKYNSPKEQLANLKQLNAKFGTISKLHYLTKSPGGQDIDLFEIGTEIQAKNKTKPAILVVANLEGNYPVSSEAALYLINQILEKKENYQDLTWYILTNANPDASLNYFAGVKNAESRNNMPLNDDTDEQTDEDPMDDLNKDGWLTQIRVKDIDGEWLISEDDPRVMRKADKSKGEKGEYKIYTEGIDNDNDGRYNEDPVGGTNVGINFPHIHHPFTATGGAWPGSADECFAIMKFVDEHPEIAMTMTYGSSNFCFTPPEGGRKGSVDYTSIRLEDEQAKMLNAEPGKRYSMEEIIELAQKIVPQGVEITESMVASFLGLGAIINPLAADLKFYEKFSKDYKEYLKNKNFDTERLEPEKAKDGSFELWSYYQLGVPSFSLNFWTLPKPKATEKTEGLSLEKMGKMSKDEFSKIENVQLDSLLKANKAPKEFDAAKVKEMVAQDKTTPEKIKAMLGKGKEDEKKKGLDETLLALLNYQDNNKGIKTFVDWQPFKHPQLSDVEIGGPVPFAENTPAESMLDSLFSIQVPWIFELTKEIPRLKIAKTELKAKGAGVYELEVWIENTGFMPFPTAMGQKNKFGRPAVIELVGNIKTLSGKKRTAVQKIAGKDVDKKSWLIQADSKEKIQIKLSSANAWGDSKEIQLVE